MTKRKHIEPAQPVATELRLRELELSKRREIARLKEANMDEGRKESQSVSVMMSGLDAHVRRGVKAADADRKRTDAAHGTRAEREARRLCIAHSYAALKLEHPDWLEKELEIETKKRCGVSTRTVQTYKHYKPAQ